MKYPPRVLQLISSGGFYGAENIVVGLALALRRLGCKCVIGAFHNAHQPNLDIARVAYSSGLDVELVECQGRFDVRAARKIGTYLKEGKFDILHAHGYKADVYGYRAAKEAGTPTIATAHNWPGKTIKLRCYAAFDRRILRRFDHVCAVSNQVKEQLERSGVPAGRITLISNGIPLDQFSGGLPRLRSELGLQANRIVGFVGRLAEEKGLLHLFAAIPEIVTAAPDVVFVLVGDGPLRATLEALVRQLHLERNVVFLGQRRDLADIYASLDIFVLPSLGEGLPLAVLEAMAAGKPVIATRTGAIPQVVTDSRNGFLVDPGDAKQLCEAVSALLQRKDLREEFGRDAYTCVKEKYTCEQMAEHYLAVYRRVLSESSVADVTITPPTVDREGDRAPQ